MSKRYKKLVDLAADYIFAAARWRGWRQARLGRNVMEPEDAIVDILSQIAERHGVDALFFSPAPRYKFQLITDWKFIDGSAYANGFARRVSVS